MNIERLWGLVCQLPGGKYQPRLIRMSKLKPGDIFSFQNPPGPPVGRRFYLYIGTSGGQGDGPAVIIALHRRQLCPNQSRGGIVYLWGRIKLSADYYEVFEEAIKKRQKVVLGGNFEI